MRRPASADTRTEVAPEVATDVPTEMTTEMTTETARRRQHWRLNRLFTGGLLLVWLLVTLGSTYFARDLSFSFFGWPFSFWLAAQGALLIYVLLVVVHAVGMNWLDHRFDLQERD